MGVIQNITDALHNPVPVSTVDDILRPGAGNPLIERGFAVTSIDALANWARTGSIRRRNGPCPDGGIGRRTTLRW